MLMTPKQLADLFGVTPQCVTGWCRAGYLVGDADRIGGRWVIRWSPLMMSSLPVIEIRRTRAGTVKQIVGKRGRGRPPGSRNKKPYPKGVKRPRKAL